MIGPIRFFGAASLLALGAGMPVASAEPAPPCSFTLSAPQVVQVSGVDLVTATLTPAECGPSARPYMSVACLQVQGDGSPKQCMQGRGDAPAQVYYAPYRPGAIYAATGRGCGSWVGHEIAPDCQQLGPFTATL